MTRLEGEVRDAWARLRDELDVTPGSPEEAELAWLVVDDPGRTTGEQWTGRWTGSPAPTAGHR
ncbi:MULTISPECIES: hypothetical protein [unclassified Micromonospora]|uniref:hypothetical protein n=1 Tax=unclassified Micromonospora TaxID=2617518 RepID=UPI001FFD2A09|nr:MULTISPECIES: hypothetical protein [unclassified Micromonospora]